LYRALKLSPPASGVAFKLTYPALLLDQLPWDVAWRFRISSASPSARERSLARRFMPPVFSK